MATTPDAKPKPVQDKILVSRLDTAQMLNVSVRTIDALVAQKRLKARRLGARVLFLIADVQAFAKGL